MGCVVQSAWRAVTHYRVPLRTATQGDSGEGRSRRCRVPRRASPGPDISGQPRHGKESAATWVRVGARHVPDGVGAVFDASIEPNGKELTWGTVQGDRQGRGVWLFTHEDVVGFYAQFGFRKIGYLVVGEDNPAWTERPVVMCLVSLVLQCRLALNIRAL